MGDQRAGGGEGVVAAGADAEDAVGGLDDVARAGDQQRVLFVDDGDHGFEPTQRAVGAPFFGKFGGGAGQIGWVVFQFGFEAFHQRKSVGGGTGEANQYAVVHQAADFGGIGFDDGLAERDLAIAAHGDFAVVADGENGSRTGFHNRELRSVGKPFIVANEG